MMKERSDINVVESENKSDVDKTSLLPDKDIVNDDNDEKTVQPSSTPVNEATQSATDSIDNVEGTPKVSACSDNGSNTATASRKKVLDNANPEMLSKLNAIFMSPNPNVPLSTTFSVGGKNINTTPIPGDNIVVDKTTPKVGAAETPKSAKSAKSKFLKRYMATESSGKSTPIPPIGGNVKPPLSFLDQIKKRNCGNTPPSSFLHEIKAKGSTSNDCKPPASSAASSSGETSLVPLSTQPSLSFLEEIKARRNK